MELVITAALEESESWQEKRRLPEALSAARRADGLLAGADVDESLRQRVRARRADLELLDKLENVRLEKMTASRDGHFDWEGADGLYGQRFREAGLDVEALSAEEAGARIGRSMVASELAAVLDHWALTRQRIKGADDPSWKNLLRVARLADPDAWRTRVREALERRDRQALRELAAREEVFGLPTVTLDVLGSAFLVDKEARGHAEVFLREAQRRHPNDFWLNYNLFHFFCDMQPPPAEEAYLFAALTVALRPDSPGAHYNLGNALRAKSRLDAAIAEYQEAIRLKQDICEAHNNLGTALHAKGRLDEAIAEYQEAIRIKKDHATAHCNLGSALAAKGQLDAAIAAYREALRIKKDYAAAHYNLGNALTDKGRLDEAIDEYREALRIRKDDAKAYCFLGNVLERKGQFAEALVYHRRGHELGSKKPGWRYPSAQWVRNDERLLELDGKLPAILSGQKQPADTAERLTLAWMCQRHKHRHAAAVRFYREAFDAEPKAAGNLNAKHRYNAACSAALAGCGQGKDADQLDEKERARLRQQALDWLRADLKANRQVMDKVADKAGPAIAQRMQHWLQDEDFAGVRGEKALAPLPEAEREDWHKLWEEVAALRKRAAGQPKTASSAQP
jgi:tetratricopeptide (TPR) repeat protein